MGGIRVGYTMEVRHYISSQTVAIPLFVPTPPSLPPKLPNASSLLFLLILINFFLQDAKAINITHGSAWKERMRTNHRAGGVVLSLAGYLYEERDLT